MTFSAQIAAEELAYYLNEVMDPPPGGAQLGSIIGAHIFKKILRDAGYAIVPLSPTPEMKAAFERGWLRRFTSRYAALVASSWPSIPSPVS
jgi:hypothetical protein